MTKPKHTTRCATVAIAAMLALGPTSLMAQDTTGAILPVPAETPATAPTPQVILPMQSPLAPAQTTPQQPVIESRPQVQTVPEPAPSTTSTEPVETPTQVAATAPTTRASDPATSIPTPAERSTPAAAAATTAAPLTSDNGPLDPVVDDNTQLTPVAPMAVPQAADISSNDAVITPNSDNAIDPLLLAALFAGIVPLGLAIGTAAYLRRRSRRLSPAERERLEPIAAKAKRAPDGVATARRSPVFAQPAPLEIDSDARLGELDEPVTRRNSDFVEPAPVAPPHPSRIEPNPAGGTVVMERPVKELATEDRPAVELPQAEPHGAERERLLHRMATAEPDRANPFHSYKARRKRARLILQSIGRTFENTKPKIDLSQYTRTWPALAGWRPQTA